MPSTNPRQQIAIIDRQIDANRLNGGGAGIERDLFRQRGIAQLLRDEFDEAARLGRARRPLPKVRCPACGHVSFAAEA